MLESPNADAAGLEIERSRSPRQPRQSQCSELWTSTPLLARKGFRIPQYGPPKPHKNHGIQRV